MRFYLNKRNQVSALLSNFSQAEASYETSLNSLGSAAKENAKYLDSIEGKVAQFKATFQDLSSTVLDSSLVKMPVDLGTGLLAFLKNAITDVDSLDGHIKNLAGQGTIAQTEDTNAGTEWKGLFDDSVLTPVVENLNIIGEFIANIPSGIQSIAKALKVLPPILAAISAYGTVTKKDLGKKLPFALKNYNNYNKCNYNKATAQTKKLLENTNNLNQSGVGNDKRNVVFITFIRIITASR